MPAHVGRFLPPGSKHVEQRVHLALFAPDGQHGARQFPAQIAFVVGDVHCRGGAIVFQAGAYRPGQRERTQIFREHRLFDRVLAKTQHTKHVAQKGLGAVGEHDFRQVGNLKEEPMPVGGREILAGIAKYSVRRHDVEHR